MNSFTTLLEPGRPGSVLIKGSIGRQEYEIDLLAELDFEHDTLVEEMAKHPKKATLIAAMYETARGNYERAKRNFDAQYARMWMAHKEDVGDVKGPSDKKVDMLMDANAMIQNLEAELSHLRTEMNLLAMAQERMRERANMMQSFGINFRTTI